MTADANRMPIIAVVNGCRAAAFAFGALDLELPVCLSFGASSLVLCSPGRIIGLASLQCVPGGIGRTILPSPIAPPVVCAGNHHGVVVSPSRIRFCQKMCTRDFF